MDAFADKPTRTTIPITALTRRGYRAWLKKQPQLSRGWLDARGFEPEAGRAEVLPGRDGKPRQVVVGLGDGGTLWAFGALPTSLPKGRYRLEAGLEPELARAAALGWALGSYRFHRYKREPKPVETQLVWPDGCDRQEVSRIAEGINLARDLINTPALDLGPDELAAAARDLGKRHRAQVKVIQGKALERDFPTIAVVGQGSARPPCLIDLRWGPAEAPRVTLVGKGIVFDTGGLDLKPSSAMGLMKKDMGGAACVLGLAHMLMDAEVPVRLRVLVSAAENSVSGASFRPGDVLRTRKGLTVEIGNTDAEGRLVLCDALALASEDKPDLLIDIATLTGAARIALGYELPALFSTDDAVAAEILQAGERATEPDPLWRMPLFAAYRRHLDSPIADLNNIDNVGKGGAITAALFLKEFVEPGIPWVHIDTMAWNMGTQPGRPAGGEALGIRALYAMLSARYR